MLRAGRWGVGSQGTCMGFSHCCPKTQFLMLSHIVVYDCCLPRSVDVIGGDGCAENLGRPLQNGFKSGSSAWFSPS